MPRKPDTNKIAEYQRLCGVIDEGFAALQAAGHIPAGLALTSHRWSGQPGFAKYLAGAKEAVRDLIEFVEALSDEQRAELDVRLTSRQLPTMAAIAAERGLLLKKVMSRRAVRDDVEYRFISDMLSDVDSPHLRSSDREVASAMLATYEERRKRDA